MQDRHHAGLGAEVFGVRADDADCLGRRLEQDVVDERLVLKRDRRDRRGDGKDDMEIGDGQQFGAAIGQPLEARQTLTLRTVPVATGIVGNAESRRNPRSARRDRRAPASQASIAAVTLR